MNRSTNCSAQSARTTAFHHTALAFACVWVMGLAACGGGGDDASAGATAGGSAGGAAGTLTFTGTNNSGRTGFVPPTDATTCLAVKATFIQVNCLKPVAAVGGADDLMITYSGALTAGSVVNLAAPGGSSQVEFITTELSGTSVVTRFWGSDPVGTITLTAIDAKSVTFKLTGVSLKADTLSGGSASTGTILAEGTVTVNLK